MNNNKQGIKLYCFSPLIMIITFVIEILMALYTFIQSRKHKSDLGIVFLLIFLGLFQLSEYLICRNCSPLLWGRIGIFAITFLPVLGIYIIAKMNNNSKFLKLAVASSVAFALYFVLAPNSISDVTCSGNYIIFDIKSSIHALYGYYYFGFLILGIWEANRSIKTNKSKALKTAFKWLIVGYLSFILPLTAVYILIPITRAAIASVMCGFAVVFAIILTFKIAPIYHKHVKSKDKK